MKSSYEELIAQAEKAGGIEFEKIEKPHSELKCALDEIEDLFSEGDKRIQHEP